MAAYSKRSRAKQWLVLILVLLAAGAVTIAQRRDTARPAALQAREGPALSEAKSWGYQLQKLRPRLIPGSVDVMVVDYSRDGTGEAELTPTMIDMLRTAPDGKRRIVLCYISIGEAEDYRYYWWRHWQLKAPEWLGHENNEWKGNFAVRYWHPDWQSIIYRPSGATWLEALAERFMPWRKPYLDRIIDMGFDGVYLDRVDAFQEWERSRKGARADMVRFVTQLSAYAKSRKPGFLVVPQNGEELLTSAPYRKAIDAIAKEDLLFGIGGDETPNDKDDIEKSIGHLEKAKRQGLPVLVVEYLADAEKRAQAQRTLVSRGYVPLFAERSLSRPPQLLPALPPDPPRVPVPEAKQGAPQPPAPSASGRKKS